MALESELIKPRLVMGEMGYKCLVFDLGEVWVGSIVEDLSEYGNQQKL